MFEAILLVALVAVTGFSILYIRYLIGRIKEVSADFLAIRVLVLRYEESLKTVYNSEVFFGEPVLEALVKNTEIISEELDSIIKNYDFDEGDEIEEA